jgi:hypothetical protein
MSDARRIAWVLCLLLSLAVQALAQRPADLFALDAYAGAYGGDLYGDATVTVENGALVLRLTPNPNMVADLTHWHYDTFLIKWRKPFPWWGDGWVQFLMDNRGKVTELKLDVPNDDFWFWEPEFRKK